MVKYDLLIVNGRVVDPANGIDQVADVGIRGTRVAEVDRRLDPSSASMVYDASDKIVMPGVIDSHVHCSTPDRWVGFSMMVRAGVITAVDFGGPIESTLEGLKRFGCGLNVAGLHTIVPGENTSDSDPSYAELEEIARSAVKRGALGVKIVGGHRPSTPEVTRRIIETANKLRCYVAFHVGTTRHGSDIQGFFEALELCGDMRLHVAHVNSYCRGLTKSPALEALDAVEALKSRPHVVSESYLGTINGTTAACRNGLPVSHVTRNCLKMRGYEPNQEGMGKAILEGWAQIQVLRGGAVDLVTGQEGYEIWKAANTEVGVSFAVNDTVAMHILASARRDNGEFVVDAISTDGGAIPRNVQVERGCALVRLGALSWSDLAKKLSWNPARMFGFTSKGSLSQGFDADVTVVDPKVGRAVLGVARGKVIMVEGLVVGEGGCLLTTKDGFEFAKASGVDVEVVDLEKSWFMSR